MLALPVEIQICIVRTLSDHELSRLGSTCRFYFDLCTPKLYKCATIHAGQEWNRELKKIGSLLRNPVLRKQLTHIEVVSSFGPLLNPTLMAPVVQLLLSILCLSPRPNIQSLGWDMQYSTYGTLSIFHNLSDSLRQLTIAGPLQSNMICFERLEELSCYRLEGISISWLKGQLQCASNTLRRLRVQLHCANYSGVLMDALRVLRDSRLVHLDLQGVHISSWRLSLASLQNFSLRWCTGVDNVLIEWIKEALYRELKQLDIVSDEHLGSLESFLIHASVDYLQGLKVLVQRSDALHLGSSKRNNLRTLVLESRMDIMDPTSVKPYSNEQVQKLLETCPNLETLGLPLTVDRWTQSKLVILLLV